MPMVTGKCHCALFPVIAESKASMWKGQKQVEVTQWLRKINNGYFTRMKGKKMNSIKEHPTYHCKYQPVAHLVEQVPVQEPVVLRRPWLPRSHWSFPGGRKKWGSGAAGAASPSVGGGNLPCFLPFRSLQKIKLKALQMNSSASWQSGLSAALRASRLILPAMLLDGHCFFEQLEQSCTPRSSCRTHLPIATKLVTNSDEQATTVLPIWACFGDSTVPTALNPTGSSCSLP